MNNNWYTNQMVGMATKGSVYNQKLVVS